MSRLENNAILGFSLSRLSTHTFRDRHMASSVSQSVFVVHRVSFKTHIIDEEVGLTRVVEEASNVSKLHRVDAVGHHHHHLSRRTGSRLDDQDQDQDEDEDEDEEEDEDEDQSR